MHTKKFTNSQKSSHIFLPINGNSTMIIFGSCGIKFHPGIKICLISILQLWTGTVIFTRTSEG